jgi:hypothetical protein
MEIVNSIDLNKNLGIQIKLSCMCDFLLIFFIVRFLNDRHPKEEKKNVEKAGSTV